MTEYANLWSISLYMAVCANIVIILAAMNTFNKSIPPDDSDRYHSLAYQQRLVLHFIFLSLYAGLSVVQSMMVVSVVVPLLLFIIQVGAHDSPLGFTSINVILMIYVSSIPRKGTVVVVMVLYLVYFVQVDNLWQWHDFNTFIIYLGQYLPFVACMMMMVTAVGTRPLLDASDKSSKLNELMLNVTRARCIIDSLFPSHFRPKLLRPASTATSEYSWLNRPSIIGSGMSREPSLQQIDDLGRISSAGVALDTVAGKQAVIPNHATPVSPPPVPMTVMSTADEHKLSSRELVRRIAAVLSGETQPVVEELPYVTVVIVKFDGLEALQRAVDQNITIVLLNEVYASFDVIVAALNIVKVANVEDEYITLCSGPKHALTALRFAAAVHRLAHHWQFNGLTINNMRFSAVSFRICINSGVLGNLAPRYSVFGSTVDAAQEMVGLCPNGATLLSSTSFDDITVDINEVYVCHRYDVIVRNVLDSSGSVKEREVRTVDTVLVSDITTVMLIKHSSPFIDILDVMEKIDTSLRFCPSYIRSIVSTGGQKHLEVAVTHICGHAQSCKLSFSDSCMVRVCRPVVARASGVGTARGRHIYLEYFHPPESVAREAFLISDPDAPRTEPVSVNSMAEDTVGSMVYAGLFPTVQGYDINVYSSHTTVPPNGVTKIILSFGSNSNDYDINVKLDMNIHAWSCDGYHVRYPLDDNNALATLTNAMLLAPVLALYLCAGDENVLRGRGVPLSAMTSAALTDTDDDVSTVPLRRITMKYNTDDCVSLEKGFFDMTKSRGISHVEMTGLTWLLSLVTLILLLALYGGGDGDVLTYYGLSLCVVWSLLLYCLPKLSIISVHRASGLWTLMMLSWLFVRCSYVMSSSDTLGDDHRVVAMIHYDAALFLIPVVISPYIDRAYYVAAIIIYIVLSSVLYVVFNELTHAIARLVLDAAVAYVIITLSGYVIYVNKSRYYTMRRYAEEYAAFCDVIGMLLPYSSIKSVIRGEIASASVYDNTAVIFIQFETDWTDEKHGKWSDLHHHVFSALDKLCVSHKLLKLSSIHNTYVCLATRHSHSHGISPLVNGLRFAFRANMAHQEVSNGAFGVKLGVSYGAVSMGVIGHTGLVSAPSFMAWGNAMTEARAYCHSAVPSSIVLSPEACRAALRECELYGLEIELLVGDQTLSSNFNEGFPAKLRYIQLTDARTKRVDNDAFTKTSSNSDSTPTNKLYKAADPHRSHKFGQPMDDINDYLDEIPDDD